jgi:Histidine kinase
MYDYLRSGVRTVGTTLFGGLLDNSPRDCHDIHSDDSTNAARWRLVLAVGWPTKRRVRAAFGHVALGLLFAVVAQPVLVTLVAASTGDWTVLEERTHSRFGSPLSVDLWISTASDFSLSYSVGLGLIAGACLYRDLKHQELRSAHLESAWIRVRLHALRMQLNPHFLFNTLNATVAIVHQRPAAAEQMLVRLADLLRRTLSDGDSVQVRLSARREGAALVIDIENNVGLVGSSTRGYGIGLGNTRERLTAMYGGRQSVEFFPPHDGMVRARVRIPLVLLAA